MKFIKADEVLLENIDVIILISIMFFFVKLSMKRNCPSLKTPSDCLELSTLQNYWIDCHRVFWEWVGDCAMHCSPSLAPLVCIDAKNCVER